jgi:hypothetical protein
MLADHAREFVAAVETEGGAYLGRLVEVDDDQGHEVAVASRLGERHFQAIGEQEAVGESGERVVMHQSGELFGRACREGLLRHREAWPPLASQQCGSLYERIGNMQVLL